MHANKKTPVFAIKTVNLESNQMKTVHVCAQVNIGLVYI